MVNHEAPKRSAGEGADSALLDDSSKSDEGSEPTPGRSLFSQPIVALVLIAAVFIAGVVMVSSLDRVPVPPPVEEVEDDEPTDIERAQETLQELTDLGLAERIAYRSVTGIGVVDLLSGDVDQVTDFVVPAPEGGLTVLHTEDGHYVINLADPTNIGLSQISGDIESTEVANRFAAVLFGGVTGGDPDVDARYAYSLEGPFGVDAADLSLVSAAEIGRDAAHFMAPGFGAVIEGPDGETFLFGANGYRLLSEHRVLTATAAARIEERCDPTCTSYYVQGRDGEGGERELPVAIAPPFETLISPDGKWALVYNTTEVLGPSLVREGAGTQLYEAATGRLFSVTVREPGSPTWSADSSYVGWLDPAGHAVELVLVFTADRSTVSLDLDSLGAPNRDDVTMTFLGSAPSE